MTKKHFAKVVSGRGECVYLVNGTNTKGTRCWYYVLVDKAKLKKFNDVLESGKGALDVEAYGKILAFGEGSEPPASTKKELEEKYNIMLVA